MNAVRGSIVVIVASLLLAPFPLAAQESKSAAAVSELARLLDGMKLDAVAAPQGPDRFVAALYFQGSQLLVVSAKYSVPERLKFLIAEKQYRDAYADLSSASERETKVFVMDLGADGLRMRREENEPFDTVDTSDGSISFDGDRRERSEEEYRKAFISSDEQYTAMLQALIAALKKPS
jgi:hypothetical protein